VFLICFSSKILITVPKPLQNRSSFFSFFHVFFNVFHVFQVCLHRFFKACRTLINFWVSENPSARLFRGHAYQVWRLPAGSGTLISRARLPGVKACKRAREMMDSPWISKARTKEIVKDFLSQDKENP